MKRTNHIVHACVVLTACALAACGGSGTPAGPDAQKTASVAHVRLVDASPDIETATVQAGVAITCSFSTTDPVLGALVSVTINGVQQVAAFPFGAVTNYITVPAGTVQIAVFRPGSADNGCPPFSQTFTLASGSYQTLAVTGRYAAGNLAFTEFTDNASSSPNVEFYNASPSNPSVNAGEFTPGQSNYQQATSVAFGSSAALAVPATAFGVYAAAAGSAPVTILPSSIDTYDTGNVLPFNNASQLAIFLLDDGSLVGAFN